MCISSSSSVLTGYRALPYEGEFGAADFAKVKKELGRLIKKEEDSVLIFRFRDKYAFEKQVIGTERNPVTNML